MLGFFGSNYDFAEFPTDKWSFKKFVKSFSLICVDENGEQVGALGAGSHWNVDCAKTSMMLFKFHIIVIMMYTMVIWVVLWEVPYRYDRLRKTTAEKKAMRKKRKKAARKKQKKKQKAMGGSSDNR